MDNFQRQQRQSFGLYNNNTPFIHDKFAYANGHAKERQHEPSKQAKKKWQSATNKNKIRD